MWEGRDAAVFKNKAMTGCMAGCWLSEWMDEWWMLERWKPFSYGEILKDEWIQNSLHSVSPLPFLIPTSLLFSLPFVAASLRNFPHLFYTLSLSFFVALILTRWVISLELQLDWLMHWKSKGRWSTTNRWVREGAKEWEERRDRRM